MNHMNDTDYRGFLGRWRLIADSCEYEQGEAPVDGVHIIWEVDGQLHFRMEWTDTDGENHVAEFSGVPDGRKQPFDGGDLADALSISVVSDRDLRSSAWYRGRELMISQRQLDETGQAMRVVQIVRLPDGSRPANIGVYCKEWLQ